MAAFDPERYLRQIGERELAQGIDIQHARLNGRAHLHHAAAALAVAGAIDGQLALTITGDYDLADALRRGADDHWRRMRRFQTQHGTSARPPASLTARRVFVLGTDIALRDAELHVQALTLTEESARLTCRVSWDDRTVRGGHGGPPDLTVTTASGRRHTASFGGGWGGGHADGHYEVNDSFALDLPWIEIDGTRIDLLAAPSGATVEIESLGPERREVRYLWQLLANFGGHHGEPGATVAAAADALVAAGRISADDPEVQAALWASDENAGRAHHPGRHRLGMGTSATAGVPDATPAEWKGLLSGTRSGPGPTGTIAVGAVTPTFDGIAVAVNELTSGADGFSATVETVGVGPANPMRGPSMSCPLAWWGSDDRGNQYLGHMNGWQGSDDHCTGQLAFGPLDPTAQELTFAVTTLAARALIRIPLNWGP